VDWAEILHVDAGGLNLGFPRKKIQKKPFLKFAFFFFFFLNVEFVKKNKFFFVENRTLALPH
jgi:hypothetical protein